MNSVVPPVKTLDYPFPAKPVALTDSEKEAYKDRIKKLLDKEDAVLISHYYTAPEIQALTEETGGFIGDSLAMARFGQRHKATSLIIAGVRFMGESAKIISPEKRVLMPSLQAECSLDLSCPADEFGDFCDQYPDHTVVVYANTSAAVKARADWIVTSGCALEIVDHLDSEDHKIIWAPDKHLGAWIEKQTGTEMIHWQGVCVVHDEFKSKALQQLKDQNPDAAILVHPESPAAVIEMADAVGSTAQLINAAIKLPNKKLIVATDRGIFYKMQQACPDKELLEAPTGDQGATCRSCAHCPWMAMNGLQQVEDALLNGTEHEVFVEEEIRIKALISLQRMLDFTSQNHK